MENNKLKENIRRNIKEEIAISNIRKEFDMETNQNKKMIYRISSACAVFVLCIVVFIGINNLNNKDGSKIIGNLNNKESLKVELNINKIKDKGLAKLDADVKIIDINELDTKFNFVKNLCIPNEYKLNNSYNLYIRKDRDTEEYNILHDYVFYYEKDELNDIRISFSEIEEPIRDYFFIEGKKVSKIGDVELIVSQLKDMYIATFKCEGIYFDIETKGITENELITLLESIINNLRNKTKNEIKEDKDVGVNEQTTEATSYPDYYAGKYVDNKGKNVVLLTKNSSENRKEICKNLGITESKTIFKEAKYSYKYLTELQNKIGEKITDKEIPFVTSSALMEDTNNIIVTVTSNDISAWNKIKELDTIGGAIDIQYNANSIVIKDLLEEK